MNGFFLSGFLFGLLGTVLLAWNYHLLEQYRQAGWLFAVLGIGVAAAQELRRHFIPRLPAKLLRAASGALAASTLVLLGAAGNPVRFAIQLAGWFSLGLAGGFLNVSLFESLHTVYRRDPAGTVTRGGILFGLGCLASAASVALAFRWNAVPQLLPALAVVPILFGVLHLAQKSAVPPPGPEPAVRDALREFSKPGALLFALLLLFQSGSEWTVAGWLPLFLTHRLGVSPETALWMLALYWLALLSGRVATIYLLARFRHSRVLFSSAFAALCGCLLLVLTDNSFGAAFSILLLGGGFAAVYPLLAEKMGSRFPEYHPGVFNSIFSVALAGGMLFPAMAGILAQSAGLMAIMAIPAIGIFLVVALLLVLWLESKVTGR